MRLLWSFSELKGGWVTEERCECPSCGHMERKMALGELIKEAAA